MFIYNNNQKKIYAIVILSLLLFLFGLYNISANSLPLRGKIIYLDPGHGGLDPGSIYKNIYEKNINLSICKNLKKQLESKGATVYMTRYGDYDLSNNNSASRKKSDLNNRAKIINKSKADMYISIHLNSINSIKWSGSQVFYDDVNEKNKDLAKTFQKKFKENLNSDRQVKEISTMLLNRKILIPGVLIEAGFLSNANDRYLLQQTWYQKRISRVITETIIEYYK